MICSMTGFGAGVSEDETGRYSIEIRAVNNRFFKAMIRLPDELAAIEPVLESVVSKRLRRGSVSVTARFVPGGATIAQQINTDAARAAIEQLLAAVPEALKDRTTIDLGSLLAAPGVVAGDSSDAFVEHARGVFECLTIEACDKVVEMRRTEGEAVYGELVAFGERMNKHIAEVKALAPRVVEAYRDRLRTRVESLIAEVGGAIEDGDLIREVAIFAERSDVAEELSRLDGHVAQFRDLLANENGEPVGRTLDFLAQEMLREANTIASKSADVEISRRIVEVKGLIDRIKEQAANVE
jgi:uncharacterized protein (TIGR00255 family)